MSCCGFRATKTPDGSRQWVSYARNMVRTAIRSYTQNVEPYPVEIAAFEDPEWQHLRTRVLKHLPIDA